MTNVSTYGTSDVRAAAFEMFKEFSVLVVEFDPGGVVQMDEAIGKYQQTVRKSLKFDD